MRVLIASTRGAGHYTPLVPFMQALARAGHELLVCGPEDLRAAVGRDGHPFRVFDDPPADELAETWDRVPSLPPDQANVVVIRDIFGRLNATASLPGLLAACEDWRPDVVLRDPAEFGAALAAELRGVPHARVAIGLASTEEMSLQVVAPAVAELRAAHGLPPDPGMDLLRASPYLTTFPATLEDPATPDQPRTLRVRDPAWDDQPESSREDGRPPLVYLTFGSQLGALPFASQVYRAAMDAVADLPVRAVLTIGHAAPEHAASPAPANVRVERWVPQRAVLGEAAAVVCHGGSGSTLGALAAGLPTVVVPLFADQPFNARRVAATGAGLAVEPPTADAIRDAVRAVLEDGAHRAAAQRLAAEMRALPPVDAAVTVLEDVAAEPVGAAAGKP